MAMADVRSFFALDWPLGVDFSISISIQSAGNMASPASSASSARICPARTCPAKRSERDGATEVKYVRFQSENQLPETATAPAPAPAQGSPRAVVHHHPKRCPSSCFLLPAGGGQKPERESQTLQLKHRAKWVYFSSEIFHF